MFTFIIPFALGEYYNPHFTEGETEVSVNFSDEASPLS